MLKFSSCFTFVLLSSSAALAASCEKQPSCEELGYSKNISDNCIEAVACPFDVAYKACLKVEEKQDTCPTGKIAIEECKAKGGIGLVYTNEVVNGVTCVTCQTCDTDYELVKNPSNRTCLDTVYYNYDGYNPHKCCEKELCPTGKITEAACTAKGGVFHYSTQETYNGNTCGTCLYCETGETLYKATEKVGCCSQIGVDNNSTGIYCCKEENECPTGSIYITSGDQISGSGAYCMGKDIELTSGNSLNRDLQFYPSCPNEDRTLTISGGAKSIVSYVNTIVKNGAWVYNLELHHGGEIQAPMPCGSYSTYTGRCQTTGSTCNLTLYGAYDYRFTSISYDNANNLPSVVSCSLEGGNPTTKPTLYFTSAPSLSGYLFSGTHGTSTSNGTNCTLATADNTCRGITCHTQNTNGTISNTGNSCY